MYENLKNKQGKAKLYNFLVKELIGYLPKNNEIRNINLVLDLCKDKSERRDFNLYIEAHLQTHFSLQTRTMITHENSENNLCLQAIDLFCGGIGRKEELGDMEWYDLYKHKIKKHRNNYLGKI